MVRDMSYIQRMNPITNKMEWDSVDENYDYHQEIARAAYADMLHDEERNKKYGDALKIAIDYMHQNGKKAYVLDIGTGTGLLSMLASRYGADEIFACEAFRPMANCAVEVVQQNGISNVKIIKKHSTELRVGEHGDIPTKANILVTEVFDTELIGEGAINTFNHAHKHLLEENSIVIPSKGYVYAQIVESSVAQQWNKLSDWSVGDFLIKVPDSIKQCPGAAAVHDIQLSLFPQTMFKPLSPPVLIFEFDWSRGNIPKERQNVLHTTAESTGSAQVVFMWWDLVMDKDEKILLSCAPIWNHPVATLPCDQRSMQDTMHFTSAIPWRDHWMQAIYYLPIEKKLQCKESFTITAYHDEFSLWFAVIGVENRNTKKGHEELCATDKLVKKKPVCECGLHFLLSRTRVGAMNDSRRRNKYVKMLQKKSFRESAAIIFGDLSLLSLVAVASNAKAVYSLESHELNRKVVKTFLQTNKYENKIKLCTTFEDILHELQADVKVENFKNITLLAEPYFTSSILPWDNIRFWYLKNDFLRYLENSAEKCSSDFSDLMTLVNSIQILPAKGFLYGMAVTFDNLWKIRSPVGYCEGFNLKVFDDLIADSSERSDSVVEAQPLWEYPCKPLTKPVLLQRFNFDQCLPENILLTNGNIQFDCAGRCDGIVMWMEYEVADGERLTMGPIVRTEVNTYVEWDMYERQGVYLLKKRTHVSQKDHLTYSVGFEPLEAEFTFQFSVS